MVHALLRPKHIAISLVLLMASLGVGLGTVHATNDAPDIPSRFATAPLMVGDRFSYDYDDWAPDYEVKSVRPFANATHTMSVVPIHVGRDGNEHGGYLLEPTTGTTVGRLDLRGYDLGGGPLSPVVGQAGAMEAVIEDFNKATSWSFGIHHPWQGIAAGPDVASYDGLPDWTIVASERIDGVLHVVAEADGHDGWFMRMLLSENLPVPLWLEDRSTIGGHLFQRGVLTGFTRGHTPIEADPPSPRPLPALKVAPPTPWVVDLTGLDMAFGPPQIDAAARADGQIKPWFDAHPEAYMTSAWPAQRSDAPMRETYDWFVGYGDGMDRLYFRIEQDKSLLDEVLETPARITFWGNDERVDPVPPLSDLAPVVTAASAVAMYRAFYGEQPNAIGFALDWFGSISGEPMQVSLSVGQTQSAGHRVEDGTLQAPMNARRILFIDATGPTGSWSSKASSEFVVTPASTGVDPPANLVAVDVPPAPAIIAAATSLAFLLALAYYLSPLVRTGGMGLFSRIRQDRVLQHPVRERMHEIVRAEPGIHYGAIRQRMGIGNGACQHHLQRLVDEGYLVKAPAGRRVLYYAKGTAGRKDMQRDAALEPPGARRVYEALASATGTSAIARSVGLSPSTVHHHLRRLAESGLVEKEGGLWRRT